MISRAKLFINIKTFETWFLVKWWALPEGFLIAAVHGACISIMHANMRRFPKMTSSWTCLWFMAGNLFFGMITYRLYSQSESSFSCESSTLVLALIASVFQAIAPFFAAWGVRKTSVVAISVIQLLAPVLNFVAQYFLMPKKVSWASVIGIFFVAVAVLLQLNVIKNRATSMKKRDLIKSVNVEAKMWSRLLKNLKLHIFKWAV